MFALTGRKPRYEKYKGWFRVSVIDGSDGLGDVSFDDVEQPLSEPEIIYPTKWLVLENLSDVEYRRLSDKLYELRSKTHMITLSVEGMELYKDDSLQGQVIFEDWCRRHRVEPIPREDT